MAELSRLAIFWRAMFIAFLSGTGATAASQKEVSVWSAAVSSNTAEAYYLYLSLYPTGEYLDEALDALRRLCAIRPLNGVFPAQNATCEVVPPVVAAPAVVTPVQVAPRQAVEPRDPYQ